MKNIALTFKKNSYFRLTDFSPLKKTKREGGLGGRGTRLLQQSVATDAGS